MIALRLVKLIEACRDVPGADLFQFFDDDGHRHDIKSTHINEYLLQTTGVPFTAKDFRTWGGTHLAGVNLALTEPQSAQSKRKRQVSKMVKYVSSMLGNTPTVCRGSYIHPRIIDDYMEGEFHERWQEAQIKARRSKTRLNPDERVVMCYLKA